MLRQAFGRRLRFLRLLENLTQAALAEAVMVTEEHLGNIERGVSVPSFDLICRLASALKTHPHSLFLYTDVDLQSEDDALEALSGLDWKQYITRVGHWECNPATNACTVSRSLFAILGREPFPLDKGMDTLIKFVLPEDQASLIDAWTRFLRGEHTLAHSFRFLRKKRDLRLGLILGEEERDDSGQPVMLRGVFLDVTEQKRFESTLLATRKRMEERVAERTLSLSQALARLEKEARERERAEKERQRELKLRAQAEEEQRSVAGRLQAYEAALEASLEAFALVDKNHVYLAVNQAFLDERDLTRDQIVGHHVREIVGEQVYEASVRHHIDRCLAGEVVEYSMDHNMKNQGMRHLLIRYYPMADEQGQVGMVAAFIIDTTDTALAEERYRHLFENMPTGMAMYQAVDDGRDFRFLRFNPAAERITRISAEQAMGKRLLELFPDMDRSPLVEALRRVWRSGEPEHLPPFFYQDSVRDGWRENHLHRLPTGEVVAMFDDVTERMEALEALKENREMYRTLFELESDAIFLVDNASLMILEANRAAENMFGYSREELLDMKVTELSTEPQATAQAVGQEAAAVPLRAYKRRDGSTLTVEITTSHFLWCGRRVHIAAMRDITELRRLELMRRDVDRIMRHELRSPAQAAVTVAQVLKSELALEGDMLEIVEQLERHGRRMIETIDMHARLVRLEAGTYNKGDEPVELSALCGQTLKDLAPAADQAGLGLIFENPAKDLDLRIQGDAWLLQAALGNLVKNAMEASPPGGPVILRCLRGNGSCVLEVQNQGDIPEPVRDKMFEKYATHGKSGGQGLGCYLARLAAEAHGGSVTVDETGDGITRIRMRLPLAR